MGFATRYTIIKENNKDISQGQQPLLSELYGQNNIKGTKKVLKCALKISLGIAICLIVIVVLFSSQLVSLFNSEGSSLLATYAHKGIIIYFIGYIFTSVNVIKASYFSAINNPRVSFIISMNRSIGNNRRMAIFSNSEIIYIINNYEGMIYEKIKIYLDDIIISNSLHINECF